MTKLTTLTNIINFIVRGVGSIAVLLVLGVALLSSIGNDGSTRTTEQASPPLAESAKVNDAATVEATKEKATTEQCSERLRWSAGNWLIAVRSKN